MFKHILLATDGSALSSEAVIQAMQLARSLHARVSAMTIALVHDQAFGSAGLMLPASGSFKEQFEEHQSARANEIISEVKKAALKYGVHCFSAIVFDARPYEAIIKRAEQSQCDLIVMASHGLRGVDGVLLGSETQRVLTHTRIPVLVCRMASGTT